MDLIKNAYKDDPVDDNYCCDYLGLEDSSDSELHPLVERELECLRSTTSLFENSMILNYNQYGPDKADPPLLEVLEVNQFVTQEPDYCTGPKELHFDIETKYPTSKLPTREISTFCWDAAFKPIIGKSVGGTIPNRCVFKIRLSEKSLASVQWNNVFNHLILSSSLDGSIQVSDFVSRKQLASFPIHSKGARAAVWSLNGRQFFSSGYDCVARLLDLETGQETFCCEQEKPITSCQVHPTLDNVYLTGSFDKVCAWDIRNHNRLSIRTFVASCKQVLCMVFLPDTCEFVCSTEVVSRDSADRAIMAWDFASGALLSNQIYQERFVCPWICVDPCSKRFFAQSSGDYIAEFSASRPYKMNKYRRYEGHKSGGYNMGCCLNSDCSLLATGDVASGGIYIYQVGSARVVHRTKASPEPGVSCPVVCLDWREGPALAAGTWDGQLQFWM